MFVFLSKMCRGNDWHLVLAALMSALVGCAAPPPMQLGVKDDASASAIDRVNALAKLRVERAYDQVAKQLSKDLSVHRDDKFATLRILNELSDLYSYQIFDLEKAVEIDEGLIPQNFPVTQSYSTLYPRVEAASQRILTDKSYYSEFVTLANSEIFEKAGERRRMNEKLLRGEQVGYETRVTAEYIRDHVADVRDDLMKTPKGSKNYKILFSRLVRGEYELMRLGAKLPSPSCKSFVDRGFAVEDISFEEVSFLQLSDYLKRCHGLNGDIRYLEMALDAIYKPYTNLENEKYRWKYNKIINDYISMLIDANFKAGRFDEMLYYASLNKSRMLLEERSAFGGTQGGGKKIADFVSDDGISRNAFGLPDKAWFKTRLVSTAQYLDFYVGGTYVAEALAAGSKANRAERSVMPLNSRNSSRVRVDEPTDTFVDDSLYLTQVNAGRVTAVKLIGPQLTELRREMEKSYDAISNTKAAFASPAFQKLKTSLQITGDLTVSPDKWVATHPLDFHLQSKVVRSVNFFTSGATHKLDGIRIAGFFNPTLDLAGADGEADVIKALIPSAEIVRRETARKSALKDVASANVIHLSMHGYFNAADPTLSKLLFAGSAVDASSTDPSALYAVEMSAVPALRNRDLVFAAACQTGLLAADRTNSSELTGILRPLTANRNKNIILSLWNVSDQATGEFVKAFYQRLAATQDVKVSFHYAQDQLRAKYPHPYYWAAFYLSQAS